MKILNYFMVLIIILLLALIYGIHRDVQAVKNIIEDDIRQGGTGIGNGPDNSDNAYECRIFPCYTAPHKWQWVSQKYLTKSKVKRKGEL